MTFSLFNSNPYNYLLQLIDDFKPSTYNYLLGEDILVAPIISNSSSVEVTFPPTASWVYWWNHSLVYAGGSTNTFKNIPLDEFPAFFKKGTYEIYVGTSVQDFNICGKACTCTSKTPYHIQLQIHILFARVNNVRTCTYSISV